jgi:hypothetical protein
MKAEPLNIVLSKYGNIDKILELYNSPYDEEKLECRVWRPSYSDREYMGEEEFDNQVAEWKLAKEMILFKNVFLDWESCCCGDSGYGCSCPPYVIELSILKPEQINNNSNLVNRIQDKLKKEKLEENSWVFSFEDKNYYSDDIPFGNFSLPVPKTLSDFINDCDRIGAELIWNDWVVNTYFKSKNLIEEKIPLIQLNMFENV